MLKKTESASAMMIHNPRPLGPGGNGEWEGREKSEGVGGQQERGDDREEEMEAEVV